MGIIGLGVCLAVIGALLWLAQAGYNEIGYGLVAYGLGFATAGAVGHNTRIL